MTVQNPYYHKICVCLLYPLIINTLTSNLSFL
jgi:hypothetical protein